MRKNYKTATYGLLLALAMLLTGEFSRAAATDATSSYLSSEQIKVSGVVVNENNQPMAGAMVQVEGSNKATITDHNGAFELSGVSEGANLFVTFMGYKDVTVTANKSKLTVKMDVDAIMVDDVVVVGFGSQKKINLTGAVSVADSEVFETRPVSNATQALQGVLPGLNITSTTGGPDATPTINIRGMGNISSGSSAEPLVLIDGMEGDINTINPQDIETVSVLKDAASSSIYGSRAPFGVILITTKKGKTGKMTVNYNNSFRYSTQMNLPHTMNSWDYANYFNDAHTNALRGQIYDEERLERVYQYYTGQITTTTVADPSNPTIWGDGYMYGNDNVDWTDTIYKDWVFGQEHTISLSGGNEKQQVYASINYLKQNGMLNFGEEGSSRFSSNLKVTGDINDIFSYTYNVKYQRSGYNNPSYMNIEDETYNMNYYIVSQGWPTLPLYDNNGYLYCSPSPALQLAEGGQNEVIKNQFYQQVQLVASPVKNWNITADVNFKFQNDSSIMDWQKLYNHDVNGDPIVYDATSSVQQSGSSSNYLNPNLYSDYSFSINDAHNFKVMVGGQVEAYNIRDSWMSKDGIIVSSITEIDAASGLDTNGNAVSPSVSGNYNKWMTAGYFGRINYDYKGRYLLEANLRYDGTSRFRADQRWALFPSFSVGWNIANEKFWEDYASVVSVLKLRGSYGELGNQNTDSLYPTYQTMPISTNGSGWIVDGSTQNISYSPTLLNSYMTWESVKSTNIGIDAQALRNRLSVSFDWFNRKTEDMVGPAPEMPNTLGTDVPTQNNTDMRTYGWELSAKWNDRTAGGFGYSVGFQISDSKSKILNYPNDNRTLGITKTGGEATTYFAGQNVGDIYGYTTIGIAKTQAEVDAHNASLSNGGQSAVGTYFAVGDLMYEDLNGDGKIDYGSLTDGDTGDMTIIGNSLARYSFGINIAADYKGFDISMLFQGVLKRDVMMNNSMFWGASGGTWWSVGLEEHLDYFRAEEDHVLGQNLDSYYPRPMVYSGSNNYVSQTGYIQDASYIRLKNLQIGYTFDSVLLDKIGLSYLRVYASGENLWTGTKLSSIFDPETVTYGYQGMTYPLSSVISFGFSVNF